MTINNPSVNTAIHSELAVSPGRQPGGVEKVEFVSAVPTADRSSSPSWLRLVFMPVGRRLGFAENDQRYS